MANDLANMFKAGADKRQILVKPGPAECGIQQKFSFLKISKPTFANGDAYSSSVGRYRSSGGSVLRRSLLRNAGNLRFMSIMMQIPPGINRSAIACAQFNSLPSR